MTLDVGAATAPAILAAHVKRALRIRTGPLRGLFGLYAGQAPHDRVQVLMQLFGGQRPIEFAVGDVIRF